MLLGLFFIPVRFRVASTIQASLVPSRKRGKQKANTEKNKEHKQKKVCIYSGDLATLARFATIDHAFGSHSKLVTGVKVVNGVKVILTTCSFPAHFGDFRQQSNYSKLFTLPRYRHTSITLP